MKNVTLNINPNAITSIMPPYDPSRPPFAPPPEMPAKVTQLNFTAQFDTEIEAQEFAIMLLTHSKDNA